MGTKISTAQMHDDNRSCFQSANRNPLHSVRVLPLLLMKDVTQTDWRSFKTGFCRTPDCVTPAVNADFFQVQGGWSTPYLQASPGTYADVL